MTRDARQNRDHCGGPVRTRSGGPWRPPPIEKAASSPPPPNEYVIADPAPARSRMVSLPGGSQNAHGLIVDHRRVVIGLGEPRVATDASAEASLVGKDPDPFRRWISLWTASALYRSDAFDATLAPIAHVPDPIESVSFTPKAVLARTNNGERWGIALPNGDRAAMGGRSASPTRGARRRTRGRLQRSGCGLHEHRRWCPLDGRDRASEQLTDESP